MIFSAFGMCLWLLANRILFNPPWTSKGMTEFDNSNFFNSMSSIYYLPFHWIHEHVSYNFNLIYSSLLKFMVNCRRKWCLVSLMLFVAKYYLQHCQAIYKSGYFILRRKCLSLCWSTLLLNRNIVCSTTATMLILFRHVPKQYLYYWNVSLISYHE